MKLHELLAIEGNLENQANATRGELTNTFEKKRHLFEEKLVTFFPNGENQQPVKETQSDIQSTVEKELNWISGFIAKSIDASYQVAEANTLARADVILEDETVLLKNVPATSLLELEKRMNEILNLVKSIPTLDPAKGFTEDANRNLWQARPVRKNRTKKEKVLFVKYEATKEHPAQTELIDKDVAIGHVEECEWSGLITPARKAELINNVEVVSRAVRRARSRANEQEVDSKKKIASVILDYVFKS